MAIDQNVDLLGVAMIYAPQWLKSSQQVARQVGRGADAKITRESSLKWLDEQCQARRRRYYSIIVNLPPDDAGSNPAQTATTQGELPKKVYPPLGADPKGVEWWWSNVERLKNFVFKGEVSDSTKHWCIEHLKWVAAQKAQGKTKLGDLLEAAHQPSTETEKEAKP